MPPGAIRCEKFLCSSGTCKAREIYWYYEDLFIINGEMGESSQNYVLCS